MRRLRKLSKRTGQSLERCILLLQEICTLDGEPPGGNLPATEGASTSFFFPPDELTCKAQPSVDEKRFTTAGLHDIVCISIHMPHVTGAESVSRGEQLLRAVGDILGDWRKREKPPRQHLMAIDANVQVPPNVDAITGPSTFEVAPRDSHRRRQAAAVVAGCRVEVGGDHDLGTASCGGDGEGRVRGETFWRSSRRTAGRGRRADEEGDARREMLRTGP
ncbi:hypothetical protein N9L19_00400 [bacterium]|nr:hypothetical protein [bacterium]